jgi:hypothetical protein
MLDLGSQPLGIQRTASAVTLQRRDVLVSPATFDPAMLAVVFRIDPPQLHGQSPSATAIALMRFRGDARVGRTAVHFKLQENMSRSGQ